MFVYNAGPRQWKRLRSIHRSHLRRARARPHAYTNPRRRVRLIMAPARRPPSSAAHQNLKRTDSGKNIATPHLRNTRTFLRPGSWPLLKITPLGSTLSDSDPPDQLRFPAKAARALTVEPGVSRSSAIRAARFCSRLARLPPRSVSSVKFLGLISTREKICRTQPRSHWMIKIPKSAEVTEPAARRPRSHAPTYRASGKGITLRRDSARLRRGFHAARETGFISPRPISRSSSRNPDVAPVGTQGFRRRRLAVRALEVGFAPRGKPLLPRSHFARDRRGRVRCLFGPTVAANRPS